MVDQACSPIRPAPASIPTTSKKRAMVEQTPVQSKKKIKPSDDLISVKDIASPKPPAMSQTSYPQMSATKAVAPVNFSFGMRNSQVIMEPSYVKEFRECESVYLIP
jgi:hypothetical protein